MGVAGDFGAVVADSGAFAGASCFGAFPWGFGAPGCFVAGASCLAGGGTSCFAGGASCFMAGASVFGAGAGRSTAFFGGFASRPGALAPFPGACFFPGTGDASASGWVCCAIAAPASASEQLISNVVNLIISMCLVVESVCCIQPAEPVFPRSAQQSPNETSCSPAHLVPSRRVRYQADAR